MLALPSSGRLGCGRMCGYSAEGERSLYYDPSFSFLYYSYVYGGDDIWHQFRHYYVSNGSLIYTRFVMIRNERDTNIGDTYRLIFLYWYWCRITTPKQYRFIGNTKVIFSNCIKTTTAKDVPSMLMNSIFLLCFLFVIFICSTNISCATSWFFSSKYSRALLRKGKRFFSLNTIALC